MPPDTQKWLRQYIGHKESEKRDRRLRDASIEQIKERARDQIDALNERIRTAERTIAAAKQEIAQWKAVAESTP